MEIEKMIDQVCCVCGKHFKSIEKFDYCSGKCFLKQRRMARRELQKKAVENGKKKEK